jgi:hypothetical protein
MSPSVCFTSWLYVSSDVASCSFSPVFARSPCYYLAICCRLLISQSTSHVTVLCHSVWISRLSVCVCADGTRIGVRESPLLAHLNLTASLPRRRRHQGKGSGTHYARTSTTTSTRQDKSVRDPARNISDNIQQLRHRLLRVILPL